MHISEVVVPTPSHARTTIEADVVRGLNATMVPQRPSIYQCGASYVRLAPTERPQIVIAVDSTATAAATLRERNIRYDIIGKTATSNGQLKLRSSADSFGELDVRLSEALEKPQSFYTEGEEAVLEGTIVKIQNPRVLGGGESVSSTLNARDCWMEVRAMLVNRPRGS